MEGVTQKGRAYHRCCPRANNVGRPDNYDHEYPNHPASVYVREVALLDAVAAFYADRLFGPDRAALIAAELATVDDSVATARATDRDRLTRALADVERRQKSVLRQAQDGEPDDPFTQALRGTHNELQTQKRDTQSKIDALDAEDTDDSTRAPVSGDPTLLDELPHLALNLSDAPDALLRELFETTHLRVQIQPDGDHATISVTLPGDGVHAVSVAATAIVDTAPDGGL